MDPIVSRDEIRALARKAAATDRMVTDANPYPSDTMPYRLFDEAYWACVREVRNAVHGPNSFPRTR